MNKNSARCGAAGLRRSAIVERIRLREEWSALKDIPNETETRKPKTTKPRNQQKNNIAPKSQKNTQTNKILDRCEKAKEVSEVLRGVVVLVEVGSEPRALPLRAALTALGASVVPAWSPLVTHIIWTQGGCRSTRAKARAFACQLVSPLWVEACAAQGRKLPERMFPAPTRPSDLPSPATLRRFLKKAERENISLHNLSSDSQEGDKRPARLRLSSDTDSDTSRDTTNDTSKDKSHDSIDIGVRVNTAPRRKPEDPSDSKRPPKSKRKLFTQKEPESESAAEESDDETTAGPKKMQPLKITQRDRKDLAQAERMARLLMGAAKGAQTNKQTLGTQLNKPPRIVLTGMSRNERQEAWQIVKQLNGKVQQNVDRKTTHIILGSCHEPDNIDTTIATTKKTPKTTRKSLRTKTSIPLSMCNKCNSPGKILSRMFSTNVTVVDYSTNTKNDRRVICNCGYNDISGVRNISDVSPGDSNLAFPIELRCDNNNRINLDSDIRSNDGGIDKAPDIPDVENIQIAGDMEKENSPNNIPSDKQKQKLQECKSKPRTVNALLGAVRGCKVLRFEWVKDSLEANRWLHHIGYEVRHLRKISQKARVERSALNKMQTEYAYNIFCGMRVKISPDADQRDAITQLLTLCGAIVQDGERQNENNENNLQDGEKTTRNGAKIKFSQLISLVNKRNGGKTQVTQNGRQFGAQTQIQDGGNDFDLTVGKNKDEVSSKWVFDSVAAARIRTIRRYINN